MQKTYSADFLTHKVKKNDGVLPQYHIKGCLPFIISPEVWDMVQVELEDRKKLGKGRSISDTFASKLRCADCGSFYGKKVWHSNSDYKTSIYQCNNKFKNKVKCKTSTLTEEKIISSFKTAYSYLEKNASIEEEINDSIKFLSDNSFEENELIKVNDEIKVVTGLVQEHVKKNIKTQQDQKEYTRIYDDYKKRYDSLTNKRAELEKTMARKRVIALRLGKILFNLKNDDINKLFILIIDYAVVYGDGIIEWHFKWGPIIKVKGVFATVCKVFA